VLFFLEIAAFFPVIVTWFAILFTSRYPRGIFSFVEGVFRWHNRVAARGSGVRGTPDSLRVTRSVSPVLTRIWRDRHTCSAALSLYDARLPCLRYPGAS
jgi:hypothetical protein